MATKEKHLRIENKPYEDFVSCDSCKHVEDSLEICMLRKCIHAFSTLRECYEPMEPKMSDYTDKCGSCIYFEYWILKGKLQKTGRCINKNRKPYHQASQNACMEYVELKRQE